LTIWFTADTHFGHDNIRKYCHRPFSSVEEMNERIISNWNDVIRPGDFVYHLGDFAFHNGEVNAKRLAGLIILIKGNHDKINPSLFKLMREVKDGLHIIRINDMSITLCHYAMRVWHKSHFNHWHLYGHSHNGLPGEGKSFDVGVDANNFKPIPFDEVELRMEKLPDNFNVIHRGSTSDE
jgi:calcineurin-like phosphoesterase family protein